MKRVDLEVKISIKNMLISSDEEIQTLGWMMFVDEYRDEIIRRVKLRHWNDLTKPWQASDFLNRSIALTKRQKRNETNDSR